MYFLADEEVKLSVGAICEGFDCWLLTLAVALRVSIPFVAIAGLLVGGIGYLASRKRASKSKRIYAAIFAVGALSALFTAQFVLSRFQESSQIEAGRDEALEKLPFRPLAPQQMPAGFTSKASAEFYEQKPYVQLYVYEQGDLWFSLEEFLFTPSMAPELDPPNSCDVLDAKAIGFFGRHPNSPNRPCHLFATTGKGRQIWGYNQNPNQHWYVRIGETVILVFLQKSPSTYPPEVTLPKLVPIIESLEPTTPAEMGLRSG